MSEMARRCQSGRLIHYFATVSLPIIPKALNFVLNYEEGGEKCLLHGDTESESLISEIVGAEPLGTHISKEELPRH